ncbi:acyltransferase domain-containing protein [Planctomonas deserti]|uniref:acyltransferase domain-containing protein n=1 Tax=Planctomonas deserti TaxID=2144185 RepID=UPI000D33B534|nr:acyltransferase domain-containing protein [Planctomonas deserti]
MNTDELLTLLAIAEEDRDDCLALLRGDRDRTTVNEVLDALARSFGTFDEVPLDEPTKDELTWLHAFLLFTPTLVEWHRARGIPEDVTRDTLADVGRHVAISRRVTGEFGLQTWRWLTHHLTARIFALGRLQFALQRTKVAYAGAFEEGDWVLALHIPESGPLRPDLVDESLSLASGFFAEHFPDKPVTVATCDSWMLDPYLVERMPAETNVGSFIRRFTPLGVTKDAPAEALYFVFRTRDLSRVPELPRETSLQRAVLERADRGETWQLAWGYLDLPAGTAAPSREAVSSLA